MTRRRVSVALVTRNGVATLPVVLDAIDAQVVDAELEVVAVDSGSTDGSRELLEERAHRVIGIRPEEFDHGGTRNLAVGHSTGDVVVLLVQDAVPVGPEWLAELVRPLDGDPTVAAAFARQLPRPQADRLERWSLSRWVAAGTSPRVSRIAGRDAFDRLSPLERLDAAVLDNVCAAVRRSVWERHPFRSAPIAEDLEWGMEVLLAGRGIAFAPAAAVVHSHRRGVRYELLRTRMVHHRLYGLFGVRLVPGAGDLSRAIVATLGDHLRVVTEGGRRAPSPGELARALGLAVAWPLGQYLGGRDAVRGRPLRRRSGV